MIRKRLTREYLRKIGFQGTVITGLMISSILGWNKWNKLGPNIFNDRTLFPKSAISVKVIDGDTLELQNGIGVRLNGVNAPDRGENGFEQASQKLSDIVTNKKIWLEYDRPPLDKMGRNLAWIWVNCEKTPKFLDYNYMHWSGNKSRKGLRNNPKGCEKGKLVQEELIKSGNAKVEVYKDRGELKYEERLKLLTKDIRN